MAISPVNFTSTTARTAEDKRQKQSVKPVAYSPINNNKQNQPENNYLLKGVAVLAGITGTSILLVKGKRSNWFEQTGDKTGILNTVKGGLNTAGEKIDKQWTKVVDFFKKSEKNTEKSAKPDTKPADGKPADGKPADGADTATPDNN